MKNQAELLTGERQKGESLRAVLACNDWLRSGPGRTLADLHREYARTPENAPTSSADTLKHWSKRYNWPARAVAYDTEIDRRKSEVAEARRRKAMKTGLALDYERVIKLKGLTNLLLKQAYEQDDSGVYHNIWLPDVKQIGSGEFAERVDIERFNGPLIAEIRGLLDDLAKETGGRKHTTIETPPGDLEADWWSAVDDESA